MKKVLWIALASTLLVIIWGAWVRISHSGDGCGASWPLCQGEIIPTAAQAKTWIEYAHRAMSGLYGLLILGLFLKSRRDPKLSVETRFWMKMALLFMITEALLGAKLVLFALVGRNDTPYRAFVMSLHFFNSLLLTGSLTLAALFSSRSNWHKRTQAELAVLCSRTISRTTKLIVGLFLILGMTGTIAALSNTLYPVESLLTAIAADLNPDSHYLIRLRGLHPTLGYLVGIGLVIFLYLTSESFAEKSPQLQKRFFHLSVGFAITVIVGSLTLLLHAPTTLKLLHLACAHALWILILTVWQTLHFEQA